MHLIYADIKAEVEKAANSDRGLELLVSKLLWSLPPEHPLVPKLREALASYVYAKRCRELWKKGVERPWFKRPFGSLNVEVEHENAQEIEKELAREIGQEAVLALKKEIGRSLQGILRRERRTQ